jgi:hypothetical protein
MFTNFAKGDLGELSSILDFDNELFKNLLFIVFIFPLCEDRAR